jgi:hypothetical protein
MSLSADEAHMAEVGTEYAQTSQARDEESASQRMRPTQNESSSLPLNASILLTRMPSQ